MTESYVDPQELEKLRCPISNQKDETEEKASCENKPAKWHMILEPVLVGSMIAINVGQTSLQNFYLRTACTVDLGLDPSVCDSGVGEEFRSAEALSQAVLSKVNIGRSFVGCLIATIVLLFVGPWSDCSGRRKPLIILSLMGMSVMTTGVLLLLTFPGASTVQVLYAVQIPMSMGGNFGLLLAASFSHIGDICHSTGCDVTRTMGTHRAAMQIAHVVGAITGPLLYRSLGFYGVFPLVLFLQVSSLIYVIVYMKDVNVNSENKVSVFNWRLPVNAFTCLMRRRDGHKRAIILFMLVVALGDKIILTAEVYYAYMFYRLKFGWDDILFGSFLAYRNIVSFLGTLVILSLLKARLRLTDEIIGVLSSISFLIATAGLIASTSTIVAFALPFVGIISQGSQVVQRPLVNKQILPTEQGKVYSVLGALESAVTTVTIPLYSLLYSKTVSTMPDAWLLPGMALALLQLISFMFTKMLLTNNEKIADVEDNLNKQVLLSKEIKSDNKSNGNITPQIVDSKN